MAQRLVSKHEQAVCTLASSEAQNRQICREKLTTHCVFQKGFLSPGLVNLKKKVNRLIFGILENF